MTANEDLIYHFYTSFKLKDYRGMQECYADNAVFNDAVFKNLNADQVRAMWQMLISKGKDLQIDFRILSSRENQVNAEWMAQYTFSATRRPVVNHIKAEFMLEGGKIIKHTDTFGFYKWARQALGPTGLLLGWTPFLQAKVQKTAMKGLGDFMGR